MKSRNLTKLTVKKSKLKKYMKKNYIFHKDSFSDFNAIYASCLKTIDQLLFY